jgi:hypothetical protein
MSVAATTTPTTTTTTTTPSTPDQSNGTASVRIPTLLELSDVSLADDSAMTDTQRRIARRRVLEARARATMAELDTLTKTFQHLSPVAGASMSAPVTPSKPIGAAATSAASPTVTSAAVAATAAVRVRDVLLLSRAPPVFFNGQLASRLFSFFFLFFFFFF